MYDDDPSVAGSANRTRKQKFWGSADPAVVERLVEGEWKELPPCTDFGAALFQSTFTDLYPVFRHFPATPASCPMAKLSDELFPSLILFGGSVFSLVWFVVGQAYRSDGSPIDPFRSLCLALPVPPYQKQILGAGLEKGYAASITSYTNFDTRYLYWCAQKAQTGPNLVIRMQGRLPRVPRSLYEHPRVAEVGAYDARFVSISTIDMLYPSPTYQEFEDHDIERFYSHVPGWYVRRGADTTHRLACGDEVQTHMRIHTCMTTAPAHQGPHLLHRLRRRAGRRPGLPALRRRQPDVPRVEGLVPLRAEPHADALHRLPRATPHRAGGGRARPVAAGREAGVHGACGGAAGARRRVRRWERAARGDGGLVPADRRLEL